MVADITVIKRQFTQRGRLKVTFRRLWGPVDWGGPISRLRIFCICLLTVGWGDRDGIFPFRFVTQMSQGYKSQNPSLGDLLGDQLPWGWTGLESYSLCPKGVFPRIDFGENLDFGAPLSWKLENERLLSDRLRCFVEANPHRHHRCRYLGNTFPRLVKRTILGVSN